MNGQSAFEFIINIGLACDCDAIYSLRKDETARERIILAVDGCLPRKIYENLLFNK